jgi:hypothetical protein
MSSPRFTCNRHAFLWELPDRTPPTRMGVVDLCREKLEEALRGLSRRREQWRRPEVCWARDN